MSKSIRLFAALSLCVFGTPGAFATSGSVELAPAGADTPLIQQADDSTLSGYYLAGRLALALRDFKAAASFYAAALKEDPNNTDLLDRSVRLDVASGNITRAAEYAQKLLEARADDQLSLLTLAVTDIRAGDLDKSRERLGELKSLGGPLQELVATLIEAWTLAEDGQSASAVSLIDALTGPTWIDGFTRLHAGLIADRAGLSQVAINRLQRAYEIDNGDPRVVEAYARALARGGEGDKAEEVINRFTMQNGATDDVTDALRADIAAGPVAPMIVDASDGVAEALYGLGRGIGNNDYTLSASLLQLSLYLSPTADFPAVALGRVLESLRQHQAAIEVYRAVPKDAPLHREALMQEALNLNILKRHDEAKASLHSLLEEDPSDVQVAMSLGNVYRSLEEFDEAAKIYSDAIAKFDKVPAPLWTLHYYRGIAYERTDRWRKAEKDFRRSLELSPEHPLVLNYLGYTYIDRGENLDEALDMVRRAVNQRPDDGYIVDSLGWAYYRLGRYDDAVRELEKAVSLRSGDAVINDHLGDAYWKVGRRLEARFQWAHARDNNPEPELLKVILKKLEGGLEAAESLEKTADAEQGAGEPAEATSAQ